jgi:uncharacterized damage-inducible protein DinB
VTRDELLSLPDGYDPTTQAIVGSWAAGLDDQLERLVAAVDGLSVEALEWQSAPGTNAIGMLLAHLALVEVWWLHLVPGDVRVFAETDPHFRRLLGLGADDDGIPAKGRGFPPALRGKTAADYVALLRRARALAHETLRTWTDADLSRVVAGEPDDPRLSLRWILYHALEHFAGHFGQVLLVKHQLRDAGLVPR